MEPLLGAWIWEAYMGLFDRFGFGRDGFNRAGFNRMGYDREGYDRDGFDMNGFNRQGINKLTGRDKDGYDIDGYDEDGYDKEGYDRAGYDKSGLDKGGYNKSGYNKYGFDKDGFNEKGYDKDGYDRKGFNLNGFNRLGFDAEGYNAEGYNQEGFDKRGFDKDGYNADGFNENGIDRDGYNIYGFNADGFNKSGYYIEGYNSEGFNIYGFDRDGFNKEGISAEGYSKDMFDQDGFHIFTGFNLKGYDREGFNVNGVDKDGFDRDGFHVLTGVNRQGYNREGYNKDGYDKRGYDKNGFNKKGYNRAGYDKEGYDKDGWDKDGRDKDGYDKNGYDRSGLDRNGNINPLLERTNNYLDPLEDKLERQFFSKCCAEINGNYRKQVEKRVLRNYKPKVTEYHDRWLMIHREIEQPNWEKARKEINYAVGKVLNEPYFAHVNYKDHCELYLGKQAIHGWVTDWADERASYYYQYQIYIGNPDVGLEYVRDIIIKNRSYQGYKDLYNRFGDKEEIMKVADEHLSQILKANRNNKEIHDIVESIQRNQYEIITAEKDNDILVLGCAGSGKTMILMHRIRYIKYNNPDINMEDYIVVSPTDILAKESKELAQILQIENINQYNTASFYGGAIDHYLKKYGVNNIYYSIDETIPETTEYYSLEYLDNFYSQVVDVMSMESRSSKSFLENEYRKITECEAEYIRQLGGKERFSSLQKTYEDVLKEIQSVGKKDVSKLLTSIDKNILKKRDIEDIKEIIDYLISTGLFQNNRKNTGDNLESLFYYTRRITELMDVESFSRMESISDNQVSDLSEVLLRLQSFCDPPVQQEDAMKLLNEWDNLSNESLMEYQNTLNKRIESIDLQEKKEEILQDLLDANVFLNKQIEQKLVPEEAFDKTIQFYISTNTVVSDNIITILDYFSCIKKLEEKKHRLSSQRGKNGNGQYLFDTLAALLNVSEEKNSTSILSVSDAFVCVYFFSKYDGPFDIGKKYIYIDEFQDFSPIELNLFKQLYPSASLNLFGDFNQCINRKGINKIQDIPKSLVSSIYEIKENYRNPIEVTKYIKAKMGIEMMAVGLHGRQRDLSEIPELSIQTNDRVALIIKDGKTFDLQLTQKTNNYMETGEIIRGCINIIPVSRVKGLEFEKVIVIKAELTENEFYVACTRAILHLDVINDFEY